jgi:predicted MFS family arabinose efflux permease
VTTGAFGGILGGMSLAIIGDVFPEERRGRATGSLMSAFALATVLGVPVGLYLGTKFGWHIPFLSLAALGAAILVLSAFALPLLDSHIGKDNAHPLRSIVATYSDPNHLNAFALMTSLMIGGFAVIPYVSAYLVANVGVRETQLPLVFMTAGGLTLIAAPLIGKLADLRGKLFVYRAIAPFSAVMIITVTHLPQVRILVAVAAVSTLMVSNAGRMIAAMVMITGSVQHQRRGSFMSANASVQHFATGIGAYLGGLIIAKSSDGQLQNFGLVGWIAAAVTLASLWFAGRVRAVDDEPAAVQSSSVMAAAEATCDVGEPMVGT